MTADDVPLNPITGKPLGGARKFVEFTEAEVTSWLRNYGGELQQAAENYRSMAYLVERINAEVKARLRR